MNIAICFPGSMFHSRVVTGLQEISWMLGNANIGCLFAPSEGSNVFDVRNVAMYEVETANIPYKYQFWIDSDNPVNAKEFKLLLDTMEENKNIDILSGWSYIQGNSENNPTATNVGYLTESGYQPVIEVEGKEPFEIDYCGFGCVLIRQSVIQKLKESLINCSEDLHQCKPFSPIYKGKCIADDTGFCRRVKDIGCKIYVHPQCFVEHLKIRPIVSNRGKGKEIEYGNCSNSSS